MAKEILYDRGRGNAARWRLKFKFQALKYKQNYGNFLDYSDTID